MTDVVSLGRDKRLRGAGHPSVPCPTWHTAERELLQAWARSPAPIRRWTTLQQLAGTSRLELAETLLEKLVAEGVAQVQEQFRNTRWWPQQVIWLDLAALQRELGLRSESERIAEREELRTRLQSIGQQEPLLLDAALSLLNTPSLPLGVLQARSELLQGLLSWVAEQRRGMRRDFALHVRPHTKAISEAEWQWLAQTLDLGTFGIEHFAPLLWLAGEMSLQWDEGRVDTAALPFVGVPAESLMSMRPVKQAPACYWLIENRASFERQAGRREKEVCILWLPGRPSQAWQTAVTALLRQAPAPARISADADPAGIEIALTAGALWDAARLAWVPWCMEPHRLESSKTLPLNDYDRQTLVRLESLPDMPDALRDLASALRANQCKAEQEGWL